VSVTLIMLITLITLVTSKHTIAHTHQQMHTKGLQSVQNFTNCCMFRHQGTFLKESQTERSTSTKPNTRIFTMIKTDRAPAGMTHSTTGTRTCVIVQDGLRCTAETLDCLLTYWSQCCNCMLAVLYFVVLTF